MITGARQDLNWFLPDAILRCYHFNQTDQQITVAIRIPIWRPTAIILIPYPPVPFVNSFLILWANKALILLMGLLPPGCALLYYILDDP